MSICANITFTGPSGGRGTKPILRSPEELDSFLLPIKGWTGGSLGYVENLWIHMESPSSADLQAAKAILSELNSSHALMIDNEYILSTTPATLTVQHAHVANIKFAMHFLDDSSGQHFQPYGYAFLMDDRVLISIQLAPQRIQFGISQTLREYLLTKESRPIHILSAIFDSLLDGVNGNILLAEQLCAGILAEGKGETTLARVRTLLLMQQHVVSDLIAAGPILQWLHQQDQDGEKVPWRALWPRKIARVSGFIQSLQFVSQVLGWAANVQLSESANEIHNANLVTAGEIKRLSAEQVKLTENVRDLSDAAISQREELQKLLTKLSSTTDTLKVLRKRELLSASREGTWEFIASMMVLGSLLLGWLGRTVFEDGRELAPSWMNDVTVSITLLGLFVAALIRLRTNRSAEKDIAATDQPTQAQ